MRLLETEIHTVIETLCEQHATKSSLRVYLATYSDLSDVPEATTVRADARLLLLQLSKRAPGKLAALLDDLGGSADIAAIRDAYEHREQRAATQQPWQDRLLSQCAMFLDRHSLRSKLCMLVDQERAGAVVVRGPSKVGKSWTAQLITHIAAQRHDRIAHMPSAGSAGVSATVERLLMQLEDPHFKTDKVISPDSHWYHQQCNRILAAAGTGGPERCWIVIDRMGDVASPTTELCDYLLEAVTTTPYSRARLVLLGYPREEAPDAVSSVDVQFEELAYGSVNAGEIQDFVEWLYRDVIRAPLTPDALSSYVDRFIGGRQPHEAEFLAAAGKQLLAHVQQVLRKQGQS